MENQANYDELRKLYFSSRHTSVSPSHSKVSNLRTYKNESLSKVVTQSNPDTPLEIIETELENELKDQDFVMFTKDLNQRSSNIINALYDKYGSSTYEKIAQMINNEDFSEWNELESELIHKKIDPLLPNEVNLADDFLSILSESHLFDENPQQNVETKFDDDYAYLDALVQQDYSTLKQYQTEKSSISSILNEILENEEVSNKNYQDDVFNKNIDLIFNQKLDLDNTEWDTVAEVYAQDLEKLALDEAVNQIKENVVSLEKFEDKKNNNQRPQAEMTVFYAEDKVKEEKIMKQSETRERKQNRLVTFFKRFSK